MELRKILRSVFIISLIGAGLWTLRNLLCED